MSSGAAHVIDLEAFRQRVAREARGVSREGRKGVAAASERATAPVVWYPVWVWVPVWPVA
jgi:hypothetical protein